MTGFYQFSSAIRLLPGRFLMGEVSVVAELDKARAIQAQGTDHPVRGQVEYSTDSLRQCYYMVAKKEYRPDPLQLTSGPMLNYNPNLSIYDGLMGGDAHG